MLSLKHVEVENFVCFDHLDFEFATGVEKPLTIIRAENANGKTTFLRCLRWAFYGERGLPGNEPARFSLHPAWWHPKDGRVETKVSVTFETDGRTRFDEASGPTRTFQLTRSVVTIARDAVRDDEPDFQRIEPAITLLQRSTGGGWEPFSDDPAVIEQTVDLLLPWGLRDFFFMDADEATDFVGGRENKPLPKKVVVEKTTAAINELLGLETFQQAIGRVGDLQKELQREISRASGDTSLTDMQDELDELRESIRTLEAELDSKRDERTDLQGRKEQVTADLQQALKDTGAFDQLEKRLADTKKALEQAKKDRGKSLERLSALFEDNQLLTGLMVEKIRRVHDQLEPLHQRGLIPLTHIPFVRERLDQEECICGESLESGTPHRQNVETLLEESMKQEQHYNTLGSLHSATGDALRRLRAGTRDWSDRARSMRTELGELDSRISELSTLYESLDDQVRKIDREEVRVLKGEQDAIASQLDKVEAAIADRELRLSSKQEEATSLDKKVSQRQKRQRTAEDKQAASELAAHIETALANAYHRIQQEQVEDLSRRMNELFAQMAANASDEDSEKGDVEKATVQMIAEVGVRPVDGTEDQFEIFAHNRRGRALPPVEINGASRRVLALSFILALGLESNTDAPLVADSLLNMTSGKVRTNTFEVTAKVSRQPILLVTRADLSDPADLAVAQQYAGATYTLTGQWDVIGAGRGGDVVHQTVDKEVAVACLCGPHEYCEVCRREGDGAREGWREMQPTTEGATA